MSTVCGSQKQGPHPKGEVAAAQTTNWVRACVTRPGISLHPSDLCSPNVKVSGKGASPNPRFLNRFWVLHSCHERERGRAQTAPFPDTFAFGEYTSRRPT